VLGIFIGPDPSSRPASALDFLAPVPLNESKRSWEATMTIFSKIIRKEIPAKIVYEDEHCLAFQDIHPQAPTHIVLIPKKEIPTMNDVRAEHQSVLGHLLLTAPKIAAQEGIAENGYRLVINTNAYAGQTVSHIHMHILGGRPMTWPPG
jgi:histidine triad (HIT) family protein